MKLLKTILFIIYTLLLTSTVRSQSNDWFWWDDDSTTVSGGDGTPVLVLSVNLLAFATTDSSSDDVSMTFFVKNTGTASLIVSSYSGLASPYSSDGTAPDTIDAGDSLVVFVTFDRNQSSGTYLDTLVIASNGGTGNLVVSKTVTISTLSDSTLYLATQLGVYILTQDNKKIIIKEEEE